MLKNFNEMRKVDVLPYCEKREGMLYLNWAKCIDLLHENGAENVYFVPIPNERTGGSLYYSDVAFTDKNGVINRAYETRIKVVIDDKEYIMQSPVMNGTNPVKDNSMSQQRVWNSMCRSFVKCVAIHTGLGFNLWLKEEHKPFSNEVPGDEPLATEVQIKMIKSIGQKHNVNLEYWISSNGKTWKTLTEIDAGHMLNALKGYDGSPVSNTDGKNICKINGIEILPGGYSVSGNSMHIVSTDADGNTVDKYYRTNNAKLLTTNLDTIISTYEEVGILPEAYDAWKYVKGQLVDFGKGTMIPTEWGGGDKAWWADAWYCGGKPAAGTRTGRELLRRGVLSNGGIAGPSYVNGYYGLADTWWSILATLSPNAVRGEWQAAA